MLVDNTANAEGAGLKLPPTLLIFGNPNAGTVLIQKNRTIGIDLPLKVLVWETEGKVQIAYNDGADRHFTYLHPALLGVSGG